MTTQRETDSEKPALNPALVAAAAILLIIVLVGLGKHFLAGSSGPTMAQKLDLDKQTIPAWVQQDAKQCQGDIAKLSPEEQAKLRAAYPGQAAVAILGAAYANQ